MENRRMKWVWRWARVGAMLVLFLIVIVLGDDSPLDSTINLFNYNQTTVQASGTITLPQPSGVSWG